ncbi:adhesion G-protein coupled receptor G6 isoform X7 [Oxyura jamaicensis]|nr:adhesion G-protein coupled receptor G6 isoform X7 [Oxyura jamaicensis]
MPDTNRTDKPNNDLQEFRLPVTVIFRMKRNSPDSSHSRPQRQQESKIEGIKTIGIISTPIIWPVKQRPLRFSKNSADEDPERKNIYGIFRPTVSTSAAYEETSNGTLAAFSEKINLDNTAIHQLLNENILNDSRISFHGTYNAAGAVTDPSVNAAVPFLQNRSLTAEATWTLADGLGYADSESPFHSAVSRNTAYEHGNEALWIPSSSNDMSNFIHLNDVLEPESWWSETIFHHHITSDFQEERFHSLSSLSISPLRETLSFQKSRLDLLDFSPHKVYPDMIEGNTNRKPVSMLAASSEFQFRKSMYIKEHYSGGITNLNSVEAPHANPTAFFHNMKKTYTKAMPNIQLTNSITGSSRKQLVSALLVGIGRTNSALNHVETTRPLYQQSLTGMYSESDSIFLSNSDYWSHYLKYSVYFQKKISETLRNGALENNLDAFHNNNQNEDSDFSILETENINRVGTSWEPGYLDFLTKYVDISPSLTANFWTVSYHLKEVPQAFSGEPSENQWLSFNKLLSSPTEKLPSISSPTKPDSISEDTFTISLLDHGAEEINFSSHASTLERQIFSLFFLGLSKRISESNEKMVSQMQSEMNFANLTISSNDDFYFAFPFSSLKAPLSQHVVQTSPFDKALANSTKKSVVFDGLNMQVGTDIVSDRTNVTFLNNRQQLVSVLPTHPGTQPSCSRGSQTASLVNTSLNSFINSTRTHGSLQSQDILKSDAASNAVDNARSEVQMDAAIFLKSNDSVNSDFLTTALSLELRHTFHSESKFKLGVPPNSYSTPPLPQSFQNHLDSISPSLIPGWDVAELSLPTTPVTPSQLTFLGQNFLENQGDGIGYSRWAVEQEITGDKEKRNSAVQTSTNKSRLSDQDSEREVYGSFSMYRGRMSSLNIGSTHLLDFENVDYGHFANFSSLLALSRTAIMNDTMLLSSSYSGIIIQQKETILKHTLMTPGAVIHHSYMHSQMPISPVMYHQSSGLAHIHSLTNFSTGRSQNTTPYPPPNQLTGNPTVLSCLNSTEMGCLCRPEVNYSMSSH